MEAALLRYPNEHGPHLENVESEVDVAVATSSEWFPRRRVRPQKPRHAGCVVDAWPDNIDMAMLTLPHIKLKIIIFSGSMHLMRFSVEKIL
ncbi:hypothetical protein GCK72_017863 [Caenorhabditis remanei]|uniref:Uncharacterized protein n=1 Tax=Caenorhabditis remanei TaxID=31234 RepID=A0A6A5GA04_CAERE|nr:hypothetical protein GCK72_017863 [Caenorhabditis remanei]KAF1751309.1 hypothetical protein GCK72_017863 [Caenorhabditis remanei]